jgi:hypothetical protein
VVSSARPRGTPVYGRDGSDQFEKGSCWMRLWSREEWKADFVVARMEKEVVDIVVMACACVPRFVLLGFQRTGDGAEGCMDDTVRFAYERTLE